MLPSPNFFSRAQGTLQTALFFHSFPPLSIVSFLIFLDSSIRISVTPKMFRVHVEYISMWSKELTSVQVATPQGYFICGRLVLRSADKVMIKDPV